MAREKETSCASDRTNVCGSDAFLPRATFFFHGIVQELVVPNKEKVLPGDRPSVRDSVTFLSAPDSLVLLHLNTTATTCIHHIVKCVAVLRCRTTWVGTKCEAKWISGQRRNAGGEVWLEMDDGCGTN